jgi:tetratricopeptide (TPR) repeat protein
MNTEEFLSRGANKFRQGDWFGGLQDWNEAFWSANDWKEPIISIPIFAPVYNTFADLCYATQDYEAAIENYSIAIRLMPDSVDSYCYRGSSYLATGDLQGAIDDFTEAIKLNSRCFWALYARGAARSYQGNLAEAIADFTEVIALNSNANGYYNRGVIQYLAGNYPEAIADLTEALRLNPNFVDAYYNRGNAFYESKEEEKAAEDYRQATNMNADPENSTDEHGCYARGLAYSRLGNTEKAVTNLEQAARLCSYYRNMTFYERVKGTLNRLNSKPETDRSS